MFFRERRMALSGNQNHHSFGEIQQNAFPARNGRSTRRVDPGSPPVTMRLNVGHRLRDVVVLKPGTIPKTPSVKLRRAHDLVLVTDFADADSE